jgi:hypothetical protein
MQKSCFGQLDCMFTRKPHWRYSICRGASMEMLALRAGTHELQSRIPALTPFYGRLCAVCDSRRYTPQALS